MKKRLVATHIFAALVGSALGAAGMGYQNQVTAPPTPTPQYLTPVPRLALSRDGLLRKVNEERLKASVPTLYYDATLQEFADQRLVQVQEGNSAGKVCSHDGFLASDVPKETGRVVSENLGCNATSEEAIVTAWLASPTHKAAMLDGQFSRVTIATDGVNAVTLFSTPQYAE